MDQLTNIIHNNCSFEFLKSTTDKFLAAGLIQPDSSSTETELTYVLVPDKLWPTELVTYFMLGLDEG